MLFILCLPFPCCVDPPSLTFADCLGALAVLHADAALDALRRVDSVRRQLVTLCDIVGLADSRDGAVSGAETAADAQILVDLEAQQRLTYACGTLLVDYMRYILIAEELEGRKDGVGSRLTESAKGVFFDVMGELFELVQILERRLAGDDLSVSPAFFSCRYGRGALSAGLVNREVEEELGYIDHAVAVVHDDKSARTHHAADGGEVVVVYLGVHEARGDASAEGPPV